MDKIFPVPAAGKMILPRSNFAVLQVLVSALPRFRLPFLRTNLISTLFTLSRKACFSPLSLTVPPRRCRVRPLGSIPALPD
jgi:hypothetical protein